MPMGNTVLVSSLLAEGTSNPPKALTIQKEKGDKVESVSQESHCDSAKGLEKKLYHINLVGSNPPQQLGRQAKPPSWEKENATESSSNSGCSPHTPVPNPTHLTGTEAPPANLGSQEVPAAVAEAASTTQLSALPHPCSPVLGCSKKVHGQLAPAATGSTQPLSQKPSPFCLKQPQLQAQWLPSTRAWGMSGDPPPPFLRATEPMRASPFGSLCPQWPWGLTRTHQCLARPLLTLCSPPICQLEPLGYSTPTCALLTEASH